MSNFYIKADENIQEQLSHMQCCVFVNHDGSYDHESILGYESIFGVVQVDSTGAYVRINPEKECLWDHFVTLLKQGRITLRAYALVPGIGVMPMEKAYTYTECPTLVYYNVEAVPANLSSWREQYEGLLEGKTDDSKT